MWDTVNEFGCIDNSNQGISVSFSKKRESFWHELAGYSV